MLSTENDEKKRYDCEKHFQVKRYCDKFTYYSPKILCILVEYSVNTSRGKETTNVL